MVEIRPAYTHTRESIARREQRRLVRFNFVPIRIHDNACWCAELRQQGREMGFRPRKFDLDRRYDFDAEATTDL